jgi:uncharacterized linocin/CFP29 family protein
MDFLKRQLAPLTEEAWHGIDERAAEVLRSILTARKVIHVDGPKGLNHTVIPEGRLTILEEDPEKVCSGLFKVKPLVETRTSFTLDRWEMDNLTRGARDVNLEPLEEAARKAALFEENAIFNGYEKGNIEGLVQAADKTLEFGQDASSIMDALTDGVLTLQNNFVTTPLVLVAGEKVWHQINHEAGAYPLYKQIMELIEGGILFSPALEGALLLPYDHEDLELNLGIDFSIGYQNHDAKEVRLYIAESFTFRVLDPALIVKFTL